MEVIQSEEESFNVTLDRGLEIFENLVKDVKSKNQTVIPGEEAFKLYDTFGFPADLTRILAEEKGLSIDETGFGREMEKQRERARKAGKFSSQEEIKEEDWNVIIPEAETEFVGYENHEIDSKIRKFSRRNGHYHVALTDTPFYAESGGQVGDRGKIVGDGFELKVVDTQFEGEENVSICVADQPLQIEKPEVKAIVDPRYRTPTTYNHTATHLLHRALRQVLGNHVRQAGSLVAPDHLRFDFTHYHKVSREQLEEIERIVNQKIQENLRVEYYYTTFEEAKKQGAMALFGEKYGDEVRVVSIRPFSLELCGGCHVKSTGEIGVLIITHETSVASGIRRIEALTGPKAIEYIQKSRNTVQELTQLFNASFEDVSKRVQDLVQHAKHLEKEVQQLQAQQILGQVDEFLENAEPVGHVMLAIQEFENMEVDLLKQLGDKLRQKSRGTVGFFVNHANGRINFVCAVTDDLIQKKKLKAGDLVKEAAQLAGGGGGGRPHLATAGAKNADKLPEVKDFIRKKLAGLKK